MTEWGGCKLPGCKDKPPNKTWLQIKCCWAFEKGTDETEEEKGMCKQEELEVLDKKLFDKRLEIEVSGKIPEEANSPAEK